MPVRPATQDDLDSLLMLGRAMRNESVTAFPEIEDARVALQLRLVGEHPDMFMAALAETNGTVTGMVTAMAGDWAFSSQKRALCDMLFVLPQWRNGTTGLRLLRAFIDWKRRIGALVAFAGISTGVHPASTGRLFAHEGFVPAGTLWRMED